MKFEPFLDRLSRIIRNDLGGTIGDVLTMHNITPAQNAADKYLRSDIDQTYKNYIQDRLNRYSSVVKQLGRVPVDTLSKALLLWDHQLFFEVHEVLEQEWIKAVGPEKEILQAMIRAAGVYIKLEYGYGDAAQKIARKAIPVLEAHWEFLADYFEPGTLVSALQECSMPPPLLRGPGSEIEG